MRRPLTRLALGVVLVASSLAFGQVETRLTVAGSVANDEFGASVSAAGDVDGDGFDDIVIGAPFDTAGGTSAGRASIHSGRTGLTLVTVTGSANQWLGHGVAGGFDINGDGIEDMAVGLANESTLTDGNGAVRAYSGANGALLFSVLGGGFRYRLGYNVALIGDLNGDGRSEVLGGAPGASGNTTFSGRALVIDGQSGATLFTQLGDFNGDRFGYTVSGIGDANGDGTPDYAVGAIRTAVNGLGSGTVYVYSGATHALLFRREGDAQNHEMGHAVSRAGDLNNDGFDDVFACANYRQGTSYARVFSGFNGSTLLQINGLGTDGFGHGGSEAGDVNGDGTNDFVVGLPSDDVYGNGAGKAIIYSGVNGGVLAEYYGQTAQERFGYFTAAAGDTNADGFADVIIGTSIGGAAGYAKVMSDCAIENYSAGLGGTQTLACSFVPGLVDKAQGLLVASGALPYAAGVIGASPMAANPTVSFYGVDVVIDVASVVTLIFYYDGVGQAAFPLNLRQPVIDGLSLFVQAFALTPAYPGGVTSSPGVRMLFCQ